MIAKMPELCSNLARKLLVWWGVNKWRNLAVIDILHYGHKWSARASTLDNYLTDLTTEVAVPALPALSQALTRIVQVTPVDDGTLHAQDLTVVELHLRTLFTQYSSFVIPTLSVAVVVIVVVRLRVTVAPVLGEVMMTTGTIVSSIGNGLESMVPIYSMAPMSGQISLALEK